MRDEPELAHDLIGYNRHTHKMETNAKTFLHGVFRMKAQAHYTLDILIQDAHGGCKRALSTEGLTPNKTNTLQPLIHQNLDLCGLHSVTIRKNTTCLQGRVRAQTQAPIPQSENPSNIGTNRIHTDCLQRGNKNRRAGSRRTCRGRETKPAGHALPTGQHPQANPQKIRTPEDHPQSARNLET